MHHRNCQTCKHARSDLVSPILSAEWTHVHCEIYNGNIPWYYSQHVRKIQEDIIRKVGCASWESNA